MSAAAVEDTKPVVVEVPEAVAAALHAFDDQVPTLGAAVGESAIEIVQDLTAPTAEGGGEALELADAAGGEDLEPIIEERFRRGPVGLLVEVADAFLGDPGGVELVGRIRRQRTSDPGTLAVGEPLPGSQEVSPGPVERVALATAMPDHLLLTTTPHIRDRRVGEADDVEPVGGATSVGCEVADRGLVAGERVNHHVADVAEGARWQGPEALCHHAFGASRDQIPQPTGVQVHDARREPLRPTERRLVQPEPRRWTGRQRLDLDGGRRRDRSPRCPPADTEARRHFRCRACAPGAANRLTQPGRDPRPGRDLRRGLSEALPTVGRVAPEAALVPHQDSPPLKAQTVSDLLGPALLHPAREHTAVRARRLAPGNLDRHHQHTVAILDGIDNAVLTETDQHARNVIVQPGPPRLAASQHPDLRGPEPRTRTYPISPPAHSNAESRITRTLGRGRLMARFTIPIR